MGYPDPQRVCDACYAAPHYWGAAAAAAARVTARAAASYRARCAQQGA
eukprot:gene30912-51982_t